MHKQVAKLYDKFILIKNIIFLYFMSTKIQIKLISPIFKYLQTLGCYKSTPLKKNLVLEIRKRHRFQKRNKNKILIIIST
jgi:hypothetical protein